MATPPRILKQTLIAQTRVFQVEQLELEFANGQRRCYERLLGGPRGAVLVLPLLDPRTLLLIREYAAGSHCYELALPKGRVEADEDLLAAANREIREEVGYAARDLRLLRSVDLAPGYIQHQTHIVLARDLYPARLPGDEPEPIQVVPWSLDRLDQLLLQEDFRESRSLLAVLLLARELGSSASTHMAGDAP